MHMTDAIFHPIAPLPLLLSPVEYLTPGLPLQEALEEIIIGPSQYAEVIRTAYVKMLEEIGIKHAVRLVSKSNIPLR